MARGTARDGSSRGLSVGAHGEGTGRNKVHDHPDRDIGRFRLMNLSFHKLRPRCFCTGEEKVRKGGRTKYSRSNLKDKERRNSAQKPSGTPGSAEARCFLLAAKSAEKADYRAEGGSVCGASGS